MNRWMPMHSRMLPLALATAMVYLALSVSATACLVPHQRASRATHHHTVHSSLCAWACHANPTVDLPPTAPQTDTLRVFAWLLFIGVGLSSLSIQQSAHTRAPPCR